MTLYHGLRFAGEGGEAESNAQVAVTPRVRAWQREAGTTGRVKRLIDSGIS